MGFLDTLWDDARGVFTDLLDFEKWKFQSQLAADREAAERRVRQQQAPVATGSGLMGFGAGSGQLLLIAGVAIGAVLLLRR